LKYGLFYFRFSEHFVANSKSLIESFSRPSKEMFVAPGCRPEVNLQSLKILPENIAA